METLAAVSESPDAEFSLEPVELDGPRADEVLVRIVATGVCHTDLTFKARIPGPVVLGHEGAGVVESVGSDIDGIVPGDHVLLSYRSCGACRQCTAGDRAYCSKSAALNMSGRRPDGGAVLRRAGSAVHGAFFGQSSFAQYAIATPDNVVVVDPGVDLTVAAPLGCGFQTGAGAVLNVLAPDSDSRVVIYGAGGVGLAAVMAARAAGVSDLVAVDPVASRRDLALELGATEAVDPTDGDVRGASHALDTTGNPRVVAAALRSLRPRGTLTVVGLGARDATIDVVDLMLTGKTLRGCTEGDATPQAFIPHLLELHALGQFPIDKLVTRYPAAEINRAVADTRSGATVKPVLLW